MNSQIESFFDKDSKWKEEYLLLREIITSHNNLIQEFKWMHPCYTFNGKNIVLIHGFKDYCALLFYKGVLIKDPAGILIQQTENVQSARQIRFKDLVEIKDLKSTIHAYIKEAIEIEKSGKKVKMKEVKDYPIPEEFQRLLDDDKEFSEAFYSLTPGRQKGYLFYIGQAKQSATRESRIEKYYQKIIEGKGIDD